MNLYVNMLGMTIWFQWQQTFAVFLFWFCISDQPKVHSKEMNILVDLIFEGLFYNVVVISAKHKQFQEICALCLIEIVLSKIFKDFLEFFILFYHILFIVQLFLFLLIIPSLILVFVQIVQQTAIISLIIAKKAIFSKEFTAITNCDVLKHNKSI